MVKPKKTMRGVVVRPEQQGTRAALFDLEADIMDLVWDSEHESFTVADVHGEFSQARAIAYTSVMTTVGGLYDKGLVARQREGRRYRYRPSWTRSEFAAAVANEVLDSLDGAGAGSAVALLTERVAAADDAELAALEALIKKRRKDLAGG